nr:uncharacterized protein LOC106681784 isoform X2 [Halyomorpha halys]
MIFLTFASESTSVRSKKAEDCSISRSSLKKSWLEISDLSVPDYSETRLRKKKMTNYSNRIRKKKKNNTLEKSTLKPIISNLKTLIPSKLASSTPKVDSEVANLVNIHQYRSISTVSPIITDINRSKGSSVESSPKGVRSMHFAPKNILEKSSNMLFENTEVENFLGFPCLDDTANTSQEFFYGFPSFTENMISEKLKILKITNETGKLKEDCKTIKEEVEDTSVNKNKLIDASTNETGILYSTLPVFCDKSTSLDLLVVDMNRQKEKSTAKSLVEVKQSLRTESSSMTLDLAEKTEDSVSISKSLQNLNTSNFFEEDVSKMVKSSSFEHPKVTKISENVLVPCKINIQQIAVECSEINVDSSDIEESVLNSADERSYSMRSGQLDEEESIIHSSDEEDASGITKERDIDGQKQLPKVDSDVSVNLLQFKELEISGNAQSEEVSAEEGDLYTESEIAKSSDSIEVSRTANLENISSDVSTSSDKDILKDDESGIVLSSNLNINDKLDVKQITNYNITRSCSAKSKDSSFYSAENSASDDSERDCEYESDGELSCESNKSSRRSSLESSKSLTRETLEQLRETVSSLRIQDEYEDNICKSRKSLSKRGTEWECPPSPRRSIFTLAPLFPLPENQEDPTDDSTQAEGSMYDSATASEEDSNQSGSMRAKDRFKEEFGRNEEMGRSSGEDDSTKHSPVREASRLRRSRRLSRKSRESESKLNMVIEESDSESTEAEIVQQIEHIVLPTGKKYRRSLTILKHLGEEETSISTVPKGRNYDLSIESVINLQCKTGTDFRDGRKSLMNKRNSLLSQCRTPTSSPAPRRFRRLSHLSVTQAASPTIVNKRLSVAGAIMEESIEKSFLSGTILEESLEKSTPLLVSSKLHEVTIKEEDEEETDDKEVEEMIIMKELDVSKQSLQEMTTYEDICCQLPEDTSRSIVMKVCQQEEPISFDEILFDDWEEGSIKIGEGVFGEVFMIPRENVKNVIKIIPIEGDFPVNGEKQKKFSEICNELIIADTLSELREYNENFMSPGFAELVSSSVVKGKYPKRLIELWDEFDETRGSENESPLIFGDDQLYLVLELGNAGRDLESYSFSTAKQGLSVFKQTVCALAVAEANNEFEHRDLHWGNVLVSRTSERDIPFILNRDKYTILTNGVKATIIDFTLSRMTFPCSDFPVYCDIGQDPDMFIGTGDYQFDVYRHMRDDVKNNWQCFVPKTNVRWLHYLVDKMINKVKYQRKTAKVHTDSMKILKDIESWILNCDSAVEVALKIVQYK